MTHTHNCRLLFQVTDAFEDVLEVADCHPGYKPADLCTPTPMGRLSVRPQDNFMSQSLKSVKSRTVRQECEAQLADSPSHFHFCQRPGAYFLLHRKCHTFFRK